MKLEKKIKRILVKLIERQKIGCSKSCAAKYGIECVSIKKAVEAIEILKELK